MHIELQIKKAKFSPYLFFVDVWKTSYLWKKLCNVYLCTYPMGMNINHNLNVWRKWMSKGVETESEM